MPSRTVMAVMLAGCAGVVQAQDQDSDAFVDDSHLIVVAKNFFFSRDFRNAPARNTNGREWAQAFIANFSSGYTPGWVGLGFDVQATAAYKLDDGDGRPSVGLLAHDSDGSARDESTKVQGALKLKVSDTVIKYGAQMPTAPVFSTGTARLLLSTAEGWSVSSHDIEHLQLDAGHFTRGTGGASTNRDGTFATAYGSTPFNSATYGGFTYRPLPPLAAALYWARYEDVWDQTYFDLNYVHAMSDQQSLTLDINGYSTKNSGAAKAGQIDVFAWSTAVAYRVHAHTFTLGYQAINGNEPFDYLLQDGGNAGDSIWLNNSVQYSDFNGPHEKSLRVQYNLDLTTFGVPGLSVMARYVSGWNIDGTQADPGGAYAGAYGANEKHWERDVEVKYVVQSGPAKNLSVRLRQATHRASSFDNDVDEVRLITEYPISLF